jgi:phosphate transport system protein
MAHIDDELEGLKREILGMWTLVQLQLKKGLESLTKLDKDLAREVILSEKRVNSYELKLDRDCENIFALFSPVAVDLRYVLAVLKINTNLERIGDIAEGIAKFVVDTDNSFDNNLLDITELLLMYEECISMIDILKKAFETEDTKLARSVFKQDEILDEINLNANEIIANYIRNNVDKTEQGLYAISIIRKLERAGDQCKNIAEEIIFYVEAKVLKHKKD